jgi:hypothetical protein
MSLTAFVPLRRPTNGYRHTIPTARANNYPAEPEPNLNRQ